MTQRSKMRKPQRTKAGKPQRRSQQRRKEEGTQGDGLGCLRIRFAVAFVAATLARGVRGRFSVGTLCSWVRFAAAIVDSASQFNPADQRPTVIPNDRLCP